MWVSRKDDLEYLIHPSFINQMTIRFTQDIHTKQTVYVVCDLSGQCILLTTFICDAIAKVQEM